MKWKSGLGSAEVIVVLIVAMLTSLASWSMRCDFTMMEIAVWYQGVGNNFFVHRIRLWGPGSPGQFVLTHPPENAEEIASLTRDKIAVSRLILLYLGPCAVLITEFARLIPNPWPLHSSRKSATPHEVLFDAVITILGGLVFTIPCLMIQQKTLRRIGGSGERVLPRSVE